jgi:hypothetical protein
MSSPDRHTAASARFVRRACAFACAALLLLASSANAGTVLQFGQEFPGDTVTATDSGGVTTLSTAGNASGGGVSIPVMITNFLGSSVIINAYETFVGVTSSGPASSSGGSIFQNYSGTIEFTSGIGGTGVNYLTAAFSPSSPSSAVGLSGAAGGSEASLQATQPPDNLHITSDFATLGPPSSMAIGLSNVSPTLSIAADGSIASFTAQNAGTFSAATITVIPEPSSLCLGSFAVVFGVLVYRKKR